MNNSYLPEVFAQARATVARATASFGDLGGAQLNWKPAADSWSIGQCLDHLITSDELYYPQLEAIAAGTKESTVWERLPLLPRATGALLRWAINPDNRRKSKTFAVFEPTASSVPDTIVDDFARHTEHLIDMVTATDHRDHVGVIVTSPVGKFVTYSLKDAVVFLVLHLERHCRQATEVAQHERFPSV